MSSLAYFPQLFQVISAGTKQSHTVHVIAMWYASILWNTPHDYHMIFTCLVYNSRFVSQHVEFHPIAISPNNNIRKFLMEFTLWSQDGHMIVMWRPLDDIQDMHSFCCVSPDISAASHTLHTTYTCPLHLWSLLYRLIGRTHTYKLHGCCIFLI